MKKQHMIDVVFVITLFCVFALSTLSAIYIGSQVYKNITMQMQKNFQTTTALNYVTEKIRQNQQRDSIQLGMIEDKEAIMLYQTYDDQDYITYIYQDEGKLKELFIKAKQVAHLREGTTIIDVEQFTIKQINDELLHITLDFSDEPSQVAYVSIL